MLLNIHRFYLWRSQPWWIWFSFTKTFVSVKFRPFHWTSSFRNKTPASIHVKFSRMYILSYGEIKTAVYVLFSNTRHGVIMTSPHDSSAHLIWSSRTWRAGTGGLSFWQMFCLILSETHWYNMANMWCGGGLFHTVTGVTQWSAANVNFCNSGKRLCLVNWLSPEDATIFDFLKGFIFTAAKLRRLIYYSLLCK